MKAVSKADLTVAMKVVRWVDCWDQRSADWKDDVMVEWWVSRWVDWTAETLDEKCWASHWVPLWERAKAERWELLWVSLMAMLKASPMVKHSAQRLVVLLVLLLAVVTALVSRASSKPLPQPGR